MEETPSKAGEAAPGDQRGLLSSQRGSAHTAYAQGGQLVVEWYDFGEDSPYESATMLVFDEAAQRRLAELAKLDPGLSPNDLAGALGTRFKSYFEVRAFADEHAIPYIRTVDFMP